MLLLVDSLWSCSIIETSTIDIISRDIHNMRSTLDIFYSWRLANDIFELATAHCLVCNFVFVCPVRVCWCDVWGPHGKSVLLSGPPWINILYYYEYITGDIISCVVVKLRTRVIDVFWHCIHVTTLFNLYVFWHYIHLSTPFKHEVQCCSV